MEDLSDFIREHNYTPILFEDGDIGYTPGKELDSSCYKAMHNSDMVMLIIGGYYGSPASGEQKTDFTEYISVTRNEFRTAIKEGIPIYVFIERKVYSEYETYELNYDFIEKKGGEFKFKNTKDINVFRFIREIKGIGNIVITEFEKASEIKEFMGKQWADMMKKYLEQLRKEATEKNTANEVSDIRDLTKRMDVMLDSIGKLLLAENNKYAEVKRVQKFTRVADILASSIIIWNLDDENNDNRENMVNVLTILEDLINSNLIEAGVKYDSEGGRAETIEPFFDVYNFELVYLCFLESELQKVKEALADKTGFDILIELLCDESNYSEIFM